MGGGKAFLGVESFHSLKNGSHHPLCISKPLKSPQDKFISLPQVKGESTVKNLDT